MIGPQVIPHATMLVYLFTDLAACAEHLQSMLGPAVDASFNSISIDGECPPTTPCCCWPAAPAALRPRLKPPRPSRPH